MAKHESLHRVGKKLVKVKRGFQPEHLAAGYHEQEFGEPASRDHELLGQHGDLRVDYVEDVPGGAGGPEFRITFPDESSVTVLGADVVKAYLELYK